MLKHLLVVTHPIFFNSKIMIAISKFEKVPIPGDNMLKYTGRLGEQCSRRLMRIAYRRSRHL